MKTFLKTIGYAMIVIALFGFSQQRGDAQFFAETVTTLEATNVNSVTRSATLALELSDGESGFLNHGFVYRALSGNPTKQQIGDCVPNLGPGDDPYSQNLYRELQINNLTFGQVYFYYACARTGENLVISGDIKSFVLGNENITGCVINSASFSEITDSYGGGHFNNGRTTLNLKAFGCNEGVYIELKSVHDITHLKNRIDNLPGLFFPDDIGNIGIHFRVNEDVCHTGNKTNGWGYNCISYIEIFSKNPSEKVFSGADFTNLTKEYVSAAQNPHNSLANENAIALRANAILIGNCNGAFCWVGNINKTSNYNWKYNNTGPGTYATSNNCEVEDVIFSGMIKATKITGATPSLEIRTQGCIDIPLEISIWSRGGVPIFNFFGPVPIADPGGRISIDVDGDTYTVLRVVPTENVLKMRFRSSDTRCYGVSNDPDCLLFVEVGIYGKDTPGAFTLANGILYYVRQDNPGYEFNDFDLSEISNNEYTEYLKNGVLFSDCNVWCTGESLVSNWELFLNSIQGFRIDFVWIPPETIQTTLPTYDPDNPCFISQEEGYDPDCYELLAPIPGIGKEVNPGSGRYAILGLQNYQLGEYVQQMFNVALGIMMVLAVIMLVIAGVQYMTTESLFGKSDAKNRISGAIFGLILALGIFLIINTINPNLLEINFGKDVDVATLGIVNDPSDQDREVAGPGIIVNAPATNICTNRKDRGWFSNQSQKMAEIGKTAQTVGLQDVKADGINVKEEGNPQGTNIRHHTEQGLAGKLIELKDALLTQGIEIELTETFGPTSLAHGSPCHYTASCVDLATKNRQYPVDTVEKIIRTADSKGLVAHFEFSKNQTVQEYQNMQNELFSRGIDKCMVLYVRHASQWHFSIYDKFDESLTL